MKDIVILMRGVRNYGDIFYQVLTENQIAAYVDDNDGYFDTMEINTFLSLLSIIDNRKQDIPLLTVLRSEIFGFSVEALAEIRMTHQTGSYDTAFVQYSRAGRDDTLREKCARTLESVKTWQEMAVYMPFGGADLEVDVGDRFLHCYGRYAGRQTKTG